MNIGLKHTKVRLTLLATLVATTSALVAAPVHAGKAPPMFDGASLKCGQLPGQFVADFNVTGKGKWVFVDLEVVADGDSQTGLDWDAAKREISDPFDWNYKLGAGTVELKATLVNKKGSSFYEPGTTTVVDGTTKVLSKTCPS